MAKPWLPLGALAALVLLLPPASAAPALTGIASPSAFTLADASWRGDGAMALAVGGQPGQGVALLVQDGQASAVWQGAHRLLAVAWHPSQPFALVTGDGALMRTDGHDFTDLALPAGVESFDGRSVSWKPDGSEALISGSALLRYWPANGTLAVVRQSADERYGAVAWGPSVALVEQAQRTNGAWHLGRLLTFDGTQLTHVADAGSGASLVTRIAWDGSRALVATAEQGPGPVYRWEQGQLQAAFTPPQGFAAGIAWRDGQALLAGAGGLGLGQSDGRSFAPLANTTGDLLAAAWQPHGEQALLAGQGGALWLWSPAGLPTVSILAPLPGADAHGAVPIVAQASPRDGHALQEVAWRVDGGAWQDLALDRGAWRGTWDATGVSPGAHELEVRARDDAGPGLPVRADVRVGSGQAPALQGSVQGTVAHLAWTDTGGALYEVQDALQSDFSDAQTLTRTAQPGATLALGSGEHHVRVRAVSGSDAGPWSEPVVLTVASAPAKPTTGASPPAEEPGLKVPGVGSALLVLAGLGVALAARRR